MDCREVKSKEHSLTIDPSKLGGAFDTSKQYETVCGFEVRIGFVEDGLIRGWVFGELSMKVPAGWVSFTWTVEDLQVIRLTPHGQIKPSTSRLPGTHMLYSDLALLEKKARKQISHTFYVAEDGRVYRTPGKYGNFAEVTVNIEVQEGDKIVLTR